LSHVLEPGAGKAAGGKFVERGLEDGFAPSSGLGDPRALAGRRDGSPGADRLGVVLGGVFSGRGHALNMTDRSVIFKRQVGAVTKRPARRGQRRVARVSVLPYWLCERTEARPRYRPGAYEAPMLACASGAGAPLGLRLLSLTAALAWRSSRAAGRFGAMRVISTAT